MSTLKNKNRLLYIILILILVLLCLFIKLFDNKIHISNYNIEADLKNSISIVQISDIHNSVFGDNNIELVEKITNVKPHIIVITGDLIVSDCDNLEIATDLIGQLAKIAPVYISYGNHEIEFEQRTGTNLTEVFSNSGATILNKNYIDTEINGEEVRIGGIYGYCLPKEYKKYGIVEDEIEFLRDFEATDKYKILLSHLPYSWTNYGVSQYYNIDIVFAGHMHGGQVRIPLIGGLWDSELGLFPGKCSGVYESFDTITVLSTGLGNTNKNIPRINNPPEIVIVTLGVNYE